MRIKTIQSYKVLQILLNNEMYYNNPKSLIKTLKAPYDRMKKHYNWSHLPIFGCEVGRYCDFYGANIKNSIILSLEVPDNIAKRQVYYDWTDVIYYTEHPNKWECGNLNNFIRNTLDGIGTNDPDAIIQVTLPYIKPNWLISYENINKDFLKTYINNNNFIILT